MLHCVAVCVAWFRLDQWRGPAAPGPVRGHSHLRRQPSVVWPPAAAGHLSHCHAPVNQRWQKNKNLTGGWILLPSTRRLCFPFRFACQQDYRRSTGPEFYKTQCNGLAWSTKDQPLQFGADWPLRSSLLSEYSELFLISLHYITPVYCELQTHTLKKKRLNCEYFIWTRFYILQNHI